MVQFFGPTVKFCASKNLKNFPHQTFCFYFERFLAMTSKQKLIRIEQKKNRKKNQKSKPENFSCHNEAAGVGSNLNISS